MALGPVEVQVKGGASRTHGQLALLSHEHRIIPVEKP